MKLASPITVIPPDYYLTNFTFLVAWVVERYADVLNETEHRFFESFQRLDRASQCLFVRMSSRKGTLFRSDKLNYAEIGSVKLAAKNLVNAGFIKNDALLSLTEISTILTKVELCNLFKEELSSHTHYRKEVLIQRLTANHSIPKVWKCWADGHYGEVYRLETDHIVNNFLLLFFGNAHQNLTEFVLRDLGLYRYENYPIHQHNRIFKSRIELEEYRHLLLMRDQLATCTTLDELISIAEKLLVSPIGLAMQIRYARFYNQLGYEFERFGQYDIAYNFYQRSHLPPARERKIRLLEKQGDFMAAWQLLNELLSKPCNEHEMQIGERMAPRLAKKIGVNASKKLQPLITTTQLILPRLCDEAGTYLTVEEISRLHFNSFCAPCFYVENQLFTGLFGLWLWPEIFCGVDGAFANPFQSAPLDMYETSFVSQRPQIESLWKLFDDDLHRQHIRNHWKIKNGIENHFVNWLYLDETVLEYALECIPAQHLKLIFQRILFDIKSNRNGLPDLIQFFPETKNYCMLEIKGPGDRIQDNQQRWLEFFLNNGIPAEVVYVNWQ